MVRESNILIVDKHDQQRAYTKNLLYDAGCNHKLIFESATFKKAIVLISEKKINVILFDLDLPISNSLKQLSKLRSKYPFLPVIVLSKWSDEVIEKDAFSIGIEDYLIKGMFSSYTLKKSINYAIDRINYQKHLAIEKSKYGKLISQMNESFLEVDNNNVIIGVNQQTCKLFGYTKEELIGTSAVELLLKNEDKSEMHQRTKERLQGKSGSYETEAIKKNGEVVHLLISGTPVEDEFGNVVGSFGIMTDITELKKTQQKVIESEKLFRSVVENSPCGITVNTLDKKFIFTNTRFRRMLGLSKKDLERLTIDKLTYEVDRKSTRQKIMNLLSGENERFNIEKRYKTKKGGIVWSDTNVSTIKNERGTPEFMIAILNDITSRKIAEVELIEQKKLLESVINQSTEGIVVADKEFNFLIWNDFATDALGVGATDTQPVEWHETYGMFHEDMQTPIREEEFPIVRAITTGETVNKIMFVKNPKIKEGIFINANATPLLNKKNEIIGGMVFFTDITDKKKYEARILNQKKELERQTKNLEQFAYIATHDLRAPIINLKGLLEIFEKRGLTNEDNANLVKKINISVTNMNEMLHDLIEVIAYQRDKEHKPKNFEFKKVLDGVVQGINEQINFSDAKITHDFGDAPQINYVPGHIKSIMQNMITNAIKYRSDDRKPVIKLKTQRINGSILLEVEDNGRGIPEKDHGKVFKMYKRFHKDVDGKGVGLFITKSQVESMGGSIDFTSTENKGTKFSIHLKEL